jgi:hypothetical protein
MTNFRPCLTCKSYSHAILYHYASLQTLWLVNITFVHLRYYFAGYTPSKTTYNTIKTIESNTHYYTM